MVLRSLLAWDPGDSVLALADGRELFVYAGETQSPLWMHAANVELVGLGATHRFVVTLDESGGLTRWAHRSERMESRLQLGRDCVSLALARRGVAAALLRDGGVMVVDGSTVATVPVFEATCLAWSADGRLLAVGDGAGRVTVFDAGVEGMLSFTAPCGVGELQQPVRSLCWSAQGFWLATAGDAIWKMNSAGGNLSGLMTNMTDPPELIACSPDGGLVAITQASSKVLTFGLIEDGVSATVIYPERKITGLAFGSPPLLAIGLDCGDANVIDLLNESVMRTDPQPGRERNRWFVQVGIHPQELPESFRAASPRSPGGAPLPSKAERSKPSFSGWTSPLVGAVVGLGVGARASRGMGNDNRVVTLALGAAIGAIAGLFYWFLNRNPPNPSPEV